MLLGRTKGGGDATHFSKNPAIGTGSSAEPQLSTAERSISDFRLTGNAIARLLLPGGGGTDGALLVQKIGIVFPKYCSKGGGSSALHRVDFPNQGVNIRGHDEQIPGLVQAPDSNRYAPFPAVRTHPSRHGPRPRPFPLERAAFLQGHTMLRRRDGAHAGVR
jgi:hypothetical protein